jgi:hypothetical protein
MQSDLGRLGYLSKEIASLLASIGALDVITANGESPKMIVDIMIDTIEGMKLSLVMPNLKRQISDSRKALDKAIQNIQKREQEREDGTEEEGPPQEIPPSQKPVLLPRTLEIHPSLPMLVLRDEPQALEPEITTATPNVKAAKKNSRKRKPNDPKVPRPKKLNKKLKLSMLPEIVVVDTSIQEPPPTPAVEALELPMCFDDADEMLRKLMNTPING